jgi:hypothetical protein
MTRHLPFTVLPALLGLYIPFCAAEVKPLLDPSSQAPSLWEQPADLEQRDLFHGEWGLEYAPDPAATYALVERKHTGINPGMTVVDPIGRSWSVKQASLDEPSAEGPIEVVLSRLLSAVGYHQPPVYYLETFRLKDEWGTHTEPGGRFRLKLKALKDRGEWSWQQNPFVGTQPYQGLLVILLMFNSSDLKNSNNTMYEYRADNGAARWFVVRDIGSALGSTGRFTPRKGDPRGFQAEPFITGIREGFVEFHYRGWHQELFRQRITPADVVWASDLLARLSARQWHDAFRAGGYTTRVAGPFITRLQEKVAEGRQLRADATYAP